MSAISSDRAEPASSSSASSSSCVERDLLQALARVDERRNCHNLVPLPWLFAELEGRLSLAAFQALVRSMARRELLDLQACNDPSLVGPQDRALAIEDPYRGLLFYAGSRER